MLCQTSSCWRDTTSGSQIYMIVITNLFYITNLKDSPVQIAIETIAQLLCHVTQMQVVVWDLTHVDMLTEIRVCGVRSTIEDSLGISQVAICALSCRSTSEDCYLELTTSLVLSNGDLCQFLCCCLGHTCWCKATHSDMFAILNHCCSLGSSNTCISHNLLNLQILRAKLINIAQTTKGFSIYQLSFIISLELLHKYIPHRNDMADASCKNKEMKNGMHVFLFV